MATPSTRPEAITGGLNPFRPRVLYSAYHVRDIERAVAFYVGVLGMRELTRFALPSGEWECVVEYPDSNGSGLILMWHPERAEPRTHGDGYSRLVLKVSDLDAAVAHLQAHGVPITTPPSQASIGVRYAMAKDPDGYTVELLQFMRRR
jgi:catechol 2,3-dioxygenase-like lactoylglutathione lyase family enzyme